MNLAVFSGSVGLEYRREQENKLEEHEWGAPGRGLACAHRAGFSGSPTPLHVIAPWALRVCGPGDSRGPAADGPLLDNLPRCKAASPRQSGRVSNRRLDKFSSVHVRHMPTHSTTTTSDALSSFGV